MSIVLLNPKLIGSKLGLKNAKGIRMIFSTDFNNGITNLINTLQNTPAKDAANEVLTRALTVRSPSEVLEIFRSFGEQLGTFGPEYQPFSNQLTMLVEKEAARIQEISSWVLPRSSSPERTVERMDVEEAPSHEEEERGMSRKRGWEEIETPMEEESEPDIEVKRRRTEEGIEEEMLPKTNANVFFNLEAIVSDPEARSLYESMFGEAFPLTPEIFQMREQAKRAGNTILVSALDSSIMQMYEQLLPIGNDWEALPHEVREKFGDIDSSIIFNSPESFKTVLSAIRAYNLLWVGIKAFFPEFTYSMLRTKEDLINAGERVARKLQEEGDAIASLNLCDCGITHLPPEVTKLKNLIELNLSWNPGIVLPWQMGRLPRLSLLNLSGCKLSKIPKFIFEIGSLNSLNVSHNEIKSISPEIWKLNCLTHLDISHNSKISIPNEIGRLNNLQSLIVSKDQIRSLPPQIQNRPWVKPL